MSGKSKRLRDDVASRIWQRHCATVGRNGMTHFLPFSKQLHILSTKLMADSSLFWMRNPGLIEAKIEQQVLYSAMERSSGG